MKTAPLLLLSALVLAGCALPASAQVSARPPGATASAPTPARPGPRLLSPEESRDSATPPGDMRPENKVVPQISVPLGKALPTPAGSKADTARRSKTAASGGIDDRVARCKALPTAQARAQCSDKLAREARGR